eukprot:TRINITY_DN2792_c0_g1_i1.p1 TRINITY_DN2792_c0_g1~~TRINITY_DN2792_c0_g1_i1.p1  ORF type:complete len:196 (+),score=77.46 TRINITY_DN2792_c0_g1_i1:126-713(+)
MWLTSDKVNSLVYWENPRDSGIAFGPVLVALLALRYISLISVVANLSLAFITATMSFRIYKSILAAVNKSSEGHPFRQFLDMDITVDNDKAAQLIQSGVTRANNLLTTLKKVFLIDNIVESAKFAIGMYLLSYVGAILNGSTLVILAWVAAFSVPRVYRDNQTQIDNAILPLKAKLDELQAKISASVPGAAKKEE